MNSEFLMNLKTQISSQIRHVTIQRFSCILDAMQECYITKKKGTSKCEASTYNFNQAPSRSNDMQPKNQ